ncbi:hypothetical protein [Pararobbsia alpina]|uniref:Uncharacterized protein n=1 Tax=Pararobbsia alpina TaxID=621374 RepID=A0A6S7BZY2_9BURK|nr:hypothetical protein [Pararobbsia alpina]CAB3804474.1 hypothetical protein LMG28138_05522 [Pararobbsia alpina]
MRIYAKPPDIKVTSPAKSSIARYLATEQAMAFERNGIGIASGSPSAEAAYCRIQWQETDCAAGLAVLIYEHAMGQKPLPGARAGCGKVLVAHYFYEEASSYDQCVPNDRQC